MLALLQNLVRRAGLDASRCPVCGALTHGAEKLCSCCEDRLALRNGGYCPTCGEMFGDDDAVPAVCPECLHAPPPWDRLAFYAPYAGVLRDLILHFKFNGAYGNARLLGELARQAAELHLTEQADGVIPVPLHRRRLAWRGFNQSSELGRAVAKALDIPLWNHALTRTRYTQPQTTLDRNERQQNIKNAFAARNEIIDGKRILLVDDVYTTGATLRECARTLRRAGATSVDVLVLARTQH
ncbi:ComF family protein [Pseudodesulfovibrio sp.]|uniref:ComF family protein n=1 Tax=unclassified Pseudodesulfovibrio TaxID=2661612 RepID=UPI003B002FD5